MKKIPKEKAFLIASEYIHSDAFKTLLRMQMLHKKGTQWTESEKRLSIELHYRSPALYLNFISDKDFSLPSRRTISSWLSVIDLMPGVSVDVLDRLKLKVNTMNSKERQVVLMFDEMSIKKHLAYNEKHDVIEGFEDLGSHGRSARIATHVLMFLVRGIYHKWKMPVAYYLSGSVTEGTILSKIIKDVLNAVRNVGLRVRVLVCDQGNNNAKAIRSLSVSKETPFFYHEGEKIFSIYDAPHLLKCVRNNLLKHDIIFKEGKASWQHVKTLYDIDVSSSKARALCMLSARHIAPNAFDKMKVKFAAQVFSHSVKAAMKTAVSTNQLPSEASQTADFLGDLNNIFDCLNSKGLSDSNPLKSAISNQPQGKMVEDTLKSALVSIPQWQVEKFKKVKNQLKRELCKPPSFHGFEQTVSAVLQLWECLSAEGVSFLMTNRLTQDAIENEFSMCRQRGGFDRNPSAMKFRQNLRHRIQVSLMKPPSTTNCEQDEEELVSISSEACSTAEDVHQATDTEEDADDVTEVLSSDDEPLPVDADDAEDSDVEATVIPPLAASVPSEKSLNLETCSVEHYKELSKIESEIQDIDKYAENPVNAYSVVRRMHYDWPSTFKLMSTSPFFYEEPNFPDGSAITEAIAHLVEWQTEKKIATKLLARGLYEGIMPHANLTASDCFEIAKYCYNKDKNLAIEWLQEAFIKVEENIGGSAKLLAQILEYTFLAKCITGDKEGAYYAFQSLATDGAFWYSPSVKLSSDYKLDQVKKCKAAAKKSLKSKEKMYPSLFQHYDWSTELCHSIRRSTQAEAGYCYVYISWQYIQFIKYEDLEEEGITIIHNFLPDELLLEIKEAAMEKFKRLSIKGLNGPVPLVNKELVSTLNKRINSKLRLPLDILGEDQQIFAYGPGGKLESLETFNKQITGNRFGALYIFLSDVARGGHIVFPDYKVSIEPTKGTLVYWTNNEDSHNVEVKECPVEVGSKWSMIQSFVEKEDHENN